RRAIWCPAGAQECCRRGPTGRRTFSRRGAVPPSRGRCAMNRPPSCGPLISLRCLLSTAIPCGNHFTSFCLCGGSRAPTLFRLLFGRLGRLFGTGPGLGRGFGPFGRLRRGGLGARLAAVGEDFGDADHREFLAVAALAPRVLAPAL